MTDIIQSNEAHVHGKRTSSSENIVTSDIPDDPKCVLEVLWIEISECLYISFLLEIHVYDGVVKQILPDSWEVVNDRDIMSQKLICRAYTGE